MQKIIIFFILALLSVNAAWAGRLMDPVVGEPQASGFNLDTVDGVAINLRDYTGKFVLLNFWATWCLPCREEMPAMSNLYDQLADVGLEVIGIHVGPSLKDVKKFLEKVPVNFTILIDKDMSLVNWGVHGLPTTFLINSNGKLIYQAIGERQWDSPEMVKFLTGLIADHGHVAVEKSPAVVKQRKSFFAVLKESIGWNRDHREPVD